MLHRHIILLFFWYSVFLVSRTGQDKREQTEYSFLFLYRYKHYNFTLKCFYGLGIDRLIDAPVAGKNKIITIVDTSVKIKDDGRLV